MADPIDTDAVRRLHTEAPVFWSGDALALCDEVDRLRAENAEYRQMQKAYKAHVRAVKQVATPLRPLDPDDGTVNWGGRSPLLHLKDAVAALLKEADQ